MAAPAPLYDMFNAVPGRYDAVNRAITLGLDGRWRRAAARACLRDRPARVLDLCCGTGDLALAIAAEAGEKVELTGFDYSPEMLARAIAKARAAGRAITFVRGTVARMPFPDGSFDAVGISFALRNLVYQNPLAGEHLRAVARVLRPGGRFVAVESGQPGVAPIRGLYHLFLRLFVRGVGGRLAGNRSAYQYLAASAERFQPPATVCALLREAGFREAAHRPLLLGAVALYEAVR
jgi:demethylmenaquinone methyltransferase/2-methoxy-6-polyprenyl-1,4-benzoquinol methylase